MNERTIMEKIDPKIVGEWIGMEDICFVTGEIITKEDRARFTFEFDAWVSEKGQEIVERQATGENPDAESLIMFREWYAQDAAADANQNNDEYREWHK